MLLKTKALGISSGGKPIVILNKEDAEFLGIHALDRVEIKLGKKKMNCIVNTTDYFVKRGQIGIFDEVKEKLKIKGTKKVEVNIAPYPKSANYITKRIKGMELNYDEFYEIVKDSIEGNLTDVELAAFVTALEENPLSLDEAANLSLAMVNTGETLDLHKKTILDKHSLGGVPGDKTSLLVVPIIAAAGYIIPKTSSRAITSPAGTADRAECLMDVELDIEEMKRVVKKTNGCIVWGGAIHLAPADDIFIKIERPLKIDPLYLPSIMAKKKAVRATNLVIDIPTGRGTKVKTISDAELLASKFFTLGKKLGMKVSVVSTYGEEPIGFSMGAALEAREALETITKKNVSFDLIDKATTVAGALLETVGIKNGKELAEKIIYTGKAEKKLREIIKEQGGNPNIKTDDIPVGNYTYDVKAESTGILRWFNNSVLVSICRAAGSPKDKGAGIKLFKKIGDKIRKGETVLRIYSSNENRIDDAIQFLEEKPFEIGQKNKMLLRAFKFHKIV